MHLGNYEREEWQKNSATVDKIPASAAVLVCMGADSRIHHYPNSALAADYYDKSCPPRRLFADYSSLRMTGRTKVRCAVKSAPFNTGSFPPWHPLLLFAISGKQESRILIVARDIFRKSWRFPQECRIGLTVRWRFAMRCYAMVQWPLRLGQMGFVGLDTDKVLC